MLNDEASTRDFKDLRLVQNRSAARSVSGFDGMSNLKSLLQKRDCHLQNRKNMFREDKTMSASALQATKNVTLQSSSGLPGYKTNDGPVKSGAEYSRAGGSASYSMRK